jgi:hypothetical protein
MGRWLATSTVNYGLRGVLARPETSGGNPRLRRCGARSRWSIILWRCGGEPSEEWSNRIRLEASGQRDTPVGLVLRPVNAMSERSNILNSALPMTKTYTTKIYILTK